MQQASGHTLKAFDEDIERLRALISQMGGLAEHAIEEAMRCLVQRDLEGAARIVQEDKKLDALEIETERRAVQLIALRAPMASDLPDVADAHDGKPAEHWAVCASPLCRQEPGEGRRPRDEHRGDGLLCRHWRAFG